MQRMFLVVVRRSFPQILTMQFDLALISSCGTASPTSCTKIASSICSHESGRVDEFWYALPLFIFI